MADDFEPDQEQRDPYAPPPDQGGPARGLQTSFQQTSASGQRRAVPVLPRASTAPPLPSPELSLPFTQADQMELQRLGQGLQSAQNDLHDGAINEQAFNEASARIVAKQKPLLLKQQQAQTAAQAMARKALMEQTALQFSMEQMHAHEEAQILPQRVVPYVDPLTGRTAHLYSDRKGNIQELKFEAHQAEMDRLGGQPDALESGEANAGQLLAPNAGVRQLHNPNYRTTHAPTPEQARQDRLREQMEALGLPLVEEMGPHPSEAQLPAPMAPPQSGPTDDRPLYNLRDEQGQPVQSLGEVAQRVQQQAGVPPGTGGAGPRILNAAGEDITQQQQEAYDRYRRTGSWAPPAQGGTNAEGILSQAQIEEIHRRAERAVPQLGPGATEYERLARQHFVQNVAQKQIDHVHHMAQTREYRKMQAAGQQASQEHQAKLHKEEREHASQMRLQDLQAKLKENAAARGELPSTPLQRQMREEQYYQDIVSEHREHQKEANDPLKSEEEKAVLRQNRPDYLKDRGTMRQEATRLEQDFENRLAQKRGDKVQQADLDKAQGKPPPPKVKLERNPGTDYGTGKDILPPSKQPFRNMLTPLIPAQKLSPARQVLEGYKTNLEKLSTMGHKWGQLLSSGQRELRNPEGMTDSIDQMLSTLQAAEREQRTLTIGEQAHYEAHLKNLLGVLRRQGHHLPDEDTLTLYKPKEE